MILLFLSCGEWDGVLKQQNCFASWMGWNKSRCFRSPLEVDLLCAASRFYVLKPLCPASWAEPPPAGVGKQRWAVLSKHTVSEALPREWNSGNEGSDHSLRRCLKWSKARVVLYIPNGLRRQIPEYVSCWCLPAPYRHKDEDQSNENTTQKKI